MPKLPRSRSLKPLAVTRPTFQPVQQEEIWWHVTEVPRFWCPACGMCANETNLEDAPYRVLVGVQKFGGRLKDGSPYFPDYKPVDGDGDPQQLIETLYRLREILPEAMAQVEEQIRELEGTPTGYRAAPQFEHPTLPEWEEEEEGMIDSGPSYAQLPPQKPVKPKRIRSKPAPTALPEPPKPRGQLPRKKRQGALPQPKQEQKRLPAPERLALPEPKKEE